MEITINKEQSLYVLNHGDHVSTRGFESLFKETIALAKRLHKPEYAASREIFGTKLVWHKYNALIEIAKERNLGMWFHADTPRAVRRYITKVPLLIANGDIAGPAMLDHCIVRIVDAATGRELYRHHNYHHGVFTLHEYYEADFEAEVRNEN